MRVLFLSDTHLGLDLPARPRVVRRRRGDDFFLNYERALEPARTGAADVVVHGGDLLYRSRVPAWLAEAALAPLKRIASSGVPVLLVPGNHERARLPYPLLALHDGLHVFDRPRTVLVEARSVRAAFIGFPYTHEIRRQFRPTLAAAMRDMPDADVRVLCMHQSVEGATCGPGNFTFRYGPDVIRTADLPRDVAVTLSGHIHRHQVLCPPGHAPVIYAGSVERTSFAEAPETKGYVIVELTRAESDAKASRHVPGEGDAKASRHVPGEGDAKASRHVRGQSDAEASRHVPGEGDAEASHHMRTTFEFRPLPARPMVMRTLSFGGADAVEAHARVAAAIASTPGDAVVQLRVTGALPATITAAALRAIAGARNVTLALRAAQ